MVWWMTVRWREKEEVFVMEVRDVEARSLCEEVIKAFKSCFNRDNPKCERILALINMVLRAGFVGEKRNL